MRLSVLDQTPVPDGATPGEALRNSIDLARHADRLGYHRYWVAEHHNTDALAGSSPEVLIGHIAENTERIRVGSGGVMLTHYSPLKVAENFRLLEALHPGRIDLGLGRAPGSDRRTASALARGGLAAGIEHYPAMVREVRGLLHDEVGDFDGLAGVAATPRPDGAPEIWLLASSPDSAAIAAHYGLPLSWAHFISPRGAEVCAAYREQFRPGPDNGEPELSIAMAVLCADTQEEAEILASSIRDWRSRGLRGRIPHPALPDTAAQDNPLRLIHEEKPLVVGTGEAARREIEAVASDYGADEVIVVSICHDHSARVHSYELLAAAFAL